MDDCSLVGEETKALDVVAFAQAIQPGKAGSSFKPRLLTLRPHSALFFSVPRATTMLGGVGK